MNKEEAANLLGIRTSVTESFGAEDPFHPENFLEGFISHQPDHRYGTLVIHTVSGIALNPPWVVHGCPKIHYPFFINETTGEREYNWPQDWERVEFYKKWDGCIHKDSPISLANGERVPISEIKPGFSVLVFDEKAKQFVPSTVKQVLSTRCSQAVNGYSGNRRQ